MTEQMLLPPRMSDAQAIALSPTQEERTLALLAHILQIVAWWLAPLVILLVRRDSRFVSFHALQVLLLQLSYFAGMVAFMFFWFFTIIFSSMLPHSSGTGSVAGSDLSSLPSGLGCAVGDHDRYGYVYGIRANQGEWAEYPVLGRLARRILHLVTSGVPAAEI